MPCSGLSTRTRFTGLLTTVVALFGATSPLVAQARTDPARSGVSRFTVTPSAIGLTAEVRPGEYLGVTGPRSAWLGLETGAAEIWVHPLKVVRDFEVHFQTPLYREPIRGASVARSVDVRPEATTITYSHAAFTVRQHIIAPHAEPGVLLLFDVEAIEPIELVIQFRPVLQYGWPAAFGGQYLFWDAARQAFVLSESLQRRNAVLGTTWPARGEQLPAHRLADAPATFSISVDPVRARTELIPVAVAAGTASRDSVFAAYRRILTRGEALYRERRTWADSVLGATTSVDSPDDALDLALEWAKINLEEQRVCNPDLGCGLVAGWGISGTSVRPGFGWFFGGDAAINTLAMDAVGQWDRVAEGLRFLARYQRADGKIPHEISQAAAHIDWFGDYPYPYYHADTTPYWMLALWKYWQASGDDTTLRELWPAFRKAYAWCLTAETDGDGIIENSVGGYGAIEVGGLGESLHQDIYLAGVWIAALQGTAALARHLGDEALSSQAASLHERARRTLNERYWREAEDQHAFAILVGGATNDNLTAWPGTAAAFRLLDDDRARRTLRKLATDSISADWGARLLSIGSPLYEPLHYNNGAVWPFMTGFVAWGQYAYRRPWAGFHLVDAIKQLTFDWSRGRHAENLSGEFYRPMDETVPHQFFATSMLITPLLRGIVGWEPDAPARKARLAPQLPPDWAFLRVRRLRAAATSLDVEIEQRAGRATTRLRPAGPPLGLEFVQSVPSGARDIAVHIDGRTVTDASVVRIEPGAYDYAVVVTVPLDGGDRVVDVTWTGGLTVQPPRVDLMPGQRSSGVRIIDFTRDASGWLLTLEGASGATYTIDVFGERVTSDDARVEPITETHAALTITFPAGTGRSVRTIPLRPMRVPRNP